MLLWLEMVSAMMKQIMQFATMMGETVVLMPTKVHVLSAFAF